MQLFAVQKNFCLKKHQSGKTKKKTKQCVLGWVKSQWKKTFSEAWAKSSRRKWDHRMTVSSDSFLASQWRKSPNPLLWAYWASKSARLCKLQGIYWEEVVFPSSSIPYICSLILVMIPSKSRHGMLLNLFRSISPTCLQSANHIWEEDSYYMMSKFPFQSQLVCSNHWF